MNRTLQASPSSQIKTGIWEDEDFVDSHSTEDKYLLVYFLTSPLRHVSGIVKMNTRLMTSHLGWEKQQLLIVLDRLVAAGDILIDGGWCWVKVYYDHNSPPAPTHSKQIKDRLADIPAAMLKIWIDDAKSRGIPVDTFLTDRVSVPCAYPTDTLSVPYAYPTDTLSVPYAYPTDRVSVNNKNNANENNNDNNNDKDNDNDNDKNSVGEVVELKFPRLLKPELVPEIFRILQGKSEAQLVLDELAAALDKGKVNDPILWVSGLVRRGLGRTAGGIEKEKERKSLMESFNNP